MEIVTSNQTVSAGEKPSLSLFSRFPISLSLSLDGGYDTNTTTSNHGQGSEFTRGIVDLLYSAGKGRWGVTITGGTDVTYFAEGASNPNPEVNGHLQLTAHYNVSSRLMLTAALDGEYQAEPDFSADIGPNRRAGYFFTMNDVLTATYYWTPVISTVTSEAFRLVKYDNAAVAAVEDRIDNTLGEQLRFNVTRRTALVGEYRFQIIDYDSSLNNSISHYFLGGIDHHFNKQLDLSLRGGATFRFFSGDSEQTEPYFQGILNYVLGHKSSLSWTTTFGFEEGASVTAVNSTAFRTGLEFRYNLTARITAAAAAYYIHDNSQASNFAGIPNTASSQDSYDLSLHLGYSVNRHWGVHVGFDTSGVASDAGVQGYTRQSYSAGVKLNF